MQVNRFDENPIITTELNGTLGDNINGPSLIRVPNWVENPLAKYYLYFSHHKGTFIRLAYADALEGPWHIHTPGVLALEDSHFNQHVASPDVHVCHERQEIWMYYHGCCSTLQPCQRTRLAISPDGLTFQANEEVLGHEYWRVFQFGGWHYVVSQPGLLYRSRDGITDFEEGPCIFPEPHKEEIDGKEYNRCLRHAAVRLRGDTLDVFYTNIGDAPERIFHATVALTADWKSWQPSEPTEILRPEFDYEGVGEEQLRSVGGPVHVPSWQLRDPCIFEEDGRIYLLYSVAGENGIAIAELVE